MSSNDPMNVQHGGNHYKDLAIQPVEYCQKNKLPFCESSVIKYVTRWRDKGGIEDLRKAIHFIQMLITLETGETVTEEVKDRFTPLSEKSEPRPSSSRMGIGMFFISKRNRKMRNEDIAEVCHEANRALCQAFGDYSQTTWDSAPEWQRKSILNGVNFHRENPEASVSCSHDNWVAVKRQDGWVYGETKDVEAKTHPRIVAFEDLPPEQQAKDFLFRQLVHSLTAK